MDALLKFSREILIWIYKHNLTFIPGHSILKRFVLKRARKYYNQLLIDVDDFQLLVDPNDTGIAPYLIAYENYEPIETSLFLKNLRPGIIVFDVGANIGYYSIMASKKIGPSGIVYSFEPEIHNFNLLTKNIEINNCKNVIPIRMAISDKNGFANLALHNENLGMHSLLYDSPKSNEHIVNVETTTLDSYIEHQQIYYEKAIIKIDVEGAEGRVLKGANELLKGDVLIFIEFCYSRIMKSGLNPEQLIDYLEGYHFDSFLICESSHTTQKIMGKELLELMIKNPDISMNVILLKNN